MVVVNRDVDVKAAPFYNRGATAFACIFAAGAALSAASALEAGMSTGLVPQVVVRGPASGFAQTVEVGDHRLTADEPLAAGGTDTGPTPYDLLAAALGSCTSMTISYYARRNQWPLESVTVRVGHSRIHAADCKQCHTKEGRVERLELAIELTGPLSAEQRQELLRIAGRCPVHKTLKSEIDIQTSLVDSQPTPSQGSPT
jgi:putative redox protein